MIFGAEGHTVDPLQLVPQPSFALQLFVMQPLGLLDHLFLLHLPALPDGRQAGGGFG